MAQSSVCYSPRQNHHDGKNKLAGRPPTKGSNHCTSISATIHTHTPAVVPVVAVLVASGSADFFVIRYSEDDLQRIIKTIFEARPLLLPTLAPVPAPVVAAAPYYEGPRERHPKAWFPKIYWGKTDLECYNFFQQYKDYFVIAGATGSNRVLFAAIFFKDTILFCWQQY